MSEKQSKWSIGYLDENAQAHGQTVRESMEVATGEKATHDVVVAVFVDGRLQFAGGDAYSGDAYSGAVLKRMAAKIQAREILERMDDEGDCVLTEERHD